LRHNGFRAAAARSAVREGKRLMTKKVGQVNEDTGRVETRRVRRVREVD
jgi:hypothetical protein